MINRLIMITVILTAILLISSCGKKTGDEINAGFFAEDFSINYTLNEASITMPLDRKLVEISGLSYSDHSQTLLAINDEDGDLFFLDPISGAILEKIEFGASDDYEGIASHNGIIYIVESNGNIKVINEKSKEKIGEYDDKLNRKNDIEGLVYDETTNQVLLAAKGDSREDDNEKNEKSIFSMNIENGIIESKPFLSINLQEAIKDLEAKYISSNAIVNLSINSRISKFGPSGIAIHPTTKDMYILSSHGRTLTVVGQRGNVKALVFLKSSVHVQPEGITFDKAGNLYISNEGRSGKAVIYKYYPLETDNTKEK